MPKPNQPNEQWQQELANQWHSRAGHTFIIIGIQIFRFGEVYTPKRQKTLTPETMLPEINELVLIFKTSSCIMLYVKTHSLTGQRQN